MRGTLDRTFGVNITDKCRQRPPSSFAPLLFLLSGRAGRKARQILVGPSFLLPLLLLPLVLSSVAPTVTTPERVKGEPLCSLTLNGVTSILNEGKGMFVSFYEFNSGMSKGLFTPLGDEIRGRAVCC